jgi:hypothetical protein
MQYTFSAYNIKRDDWNGNDILDAIRNPTEYELRLDAHTEEGLVDEVYVSLTDCVLPTFMNDGRRIPKYVHKAFSDLVKAS